MDILASTATDAAISQLLDWGRARLSKCAKRKAIERLVDETAMRAPAIPSTVDLASKFNNPHLLEELLAHRSLIDIGKDGAICLFLG